MLGEGLGLRVEALGLRVEALGSRVEGGGLVGNGNEHGGSCYVRIVEGLGWRLVEVQGLGVGFRMRLQDGRRQETTKFSGPSGRNLTDGFLYKLVRPVLVSYSSSPYERVSLGGKGPSALPQMDFLRTSLPSLQ